MKKHAQQNLGSPDRLADIYELIGMWTLEAYSNLTEAKNYLCLAAATSMHAYTVCNLGIICEDLGELNKALKFYRLALRIQPDYEEARNLLNDLIDRMNGQS